MYKMDVSASSIDFDLESLLDRAYRMDSNALGQLHDRFYAAVYRYIYFRVGDVQVSAEMAAKVFQDWLRTIHGQKKPPLGMPDWLLAAARRMVDERQVEIRKKKISLPIAEPGQVGPPSQTAGGELTQIEATRLSLRRLPADQQHILALRLVDSFTLAQVELQLGKRSNQLKALQFQALSTLASPIGTGVQVTKFPRTLQKNAPPARLLELCLHEILANHDPSDLLKRYPREAQMLHPLLLLAGELRRSALAEPVPEIVQAQSRKDLLQAAQEMVPLPPRHKAKWPKRLFWGILGFLILLALGGWAAFSLSTSSLPGDLLYPLKQVSQRARLEWEDDPALRLRLEQSYDQQSLAEVKTLVKRSQSARVNFTGGLIQMQGTEWLVDEIHVLIPGNARMVGEIKSGFYVRIQGDLQSNGVVLASQVQVLSYEIEGVLQSVAPDSIVISGVTVAISPDTILEGALEVGRRARVVALLTLDQHLLAHAVEVLK